jgi:phage shock protein C
MTIIVPEVGANGGRPSSDRPMEQRMERERRDGVGAVVIGLVLVLIGAFFLLRQFLPDLDIDRLWPIAVIGLGLLLIAGSLRRPRR